MRQSCRIILRLLLSSFLILAAIKTTEATTAVMVADTELIVNSRVIVSGKVVSVTSAWDRFGSMAWTYVEVRVDQVLKGDLSEQTIVLKQLGGTVGVSGIRVFG